MEWIYILLSGTAITIAGFACKRVIGTLDSINENLNEINENVARIQEREKGHERRIQVLEKHISNGSAA